MNGAQCLVATLLAHGARAGFCVPGESYLAVLDALHEVRDRFELIVCRQEGGVAFAAEAWGKATGEPGIAFVTRGPGACNASIGVHTAQQDSTPMILFIGQVGRNMVEREAFQEVDYRRMFGTLCKWVAEIDDARRIPEFISRAFHVATSGRPGPVVLALPEDMLWDDAQLGQVQRQAHRYQRAQASATAAQMSAVHAALQQATTPLVLLGGSTWSAAAKQQVEQWAVANRLPVACSFRRQDLFDHDLPSYIGDAGPGIAPALAQRIKDADTLLLIGARLGEMPSSGYSLVDIPRPRQTIIHVYPDPEELSRVYQADVPVVSSSANFAAMLGHMPALDSSVWQDWADSARNDYLKHQGTVLPQPGGVNMGLVMQEIQRQLPAHAALTNGAGNYTVWAHRYYRFTQFRTQFGPTSGAMGYGLPAALAVKLEARLSGKDRPVVCFAGDGCFLMNGQELATAVQHGLNIVVLVINNGSYGTIRMHQEREFPARVHGTDLVNPDFVAYAQSFGAGGEPVERTEDFAAALARALASEKPYLIEIRVDTEALTPGRTLTQIRAAAQQAGK
jgi:acetolactate synthase I/II/III large subunit